MMNTDALWTLAVANVQDGIQSTRTDTVAKDLRFEEATAKKIVLVRESGKTVNISRKMVESTYRRLVAGEALKRQASGKDGGISYTVAVTRGVVMALGLGLAEGLVAWDGAAFVATATAQARATA